MFYPDELPRVFTDAQGREYDFHSDFREWLRLETLLTDTDIPDDIRGRLMYELIFPAEKPPFNEALAYIIYFHDCGRKPRGKGKSNGKPCYSYEHDIDLIYAAFMQAYHIDLYEVPYLHWWKFRALFLALPEDTKLSKVMGWRGTDIDRRKMSDDLADFYKEMQTIYRLPKSISEQQRIYKLKQKMKEKEQS